MLLSVGESMREEALSLLPDAADNIFKEVNSLRYNSTGHALTSTAHEYKGLLEFSKTGRFPDLSIGYFRSVSLLDSYLEYLGKYENGYGSTRENERTFENLCKQYGIPAMERKLKAHIKRTLKNKIKRY